MNKAEEKYLKILREMSGAKRVKIGALIYEISRKIVEASIKEENPKISKKELLKKYLERLPK